jgi:hypothetical protein
MTPISFQTMDDHYTPIESGDEIVQADWCYSYDLGFFDSPSDPDMRVWPEAVGKRARDAVSAWEFFYKPIPDFNI